MTPTPVPTASAPQQEPPPPPKQAKLLAIDDEVAVIAGSSIVIAPLANDLGIFSDSASISVIGRPRAGSISPSANSELIYSASSVATSTLERLRYRVDAGGRTSEASIVIRVLPRLCLLDVDRSGRLDWFDLAHLNNCYNQAAHDDCTMDVNSDGVIDFEELVVLAQNLNSSVDCPFLEGARGSRRYSFSTVAGMLTDFTWVVRNSSGETEEAGSFVARSGAVTAGADGTLRYLASAPGDDLIEFAVTEPGRAPVRRQVTVHVAPAPQAPAPVVNISWPKTGLASEELGVIVNDSDLTSVYVGDYYARAHGIPSENILHIKVDAWLDRAAFSNALPADDKIFVGDGAYSLSRAQFGELRRQLAPQLRPDIKGFVLTFPRIVDVQGISITSAFALGLQNEKWFDSAAASTSPYFASPSNDPFADTGVRPTMMLAGFTLGEIKALIDRGVESTRQMLPTGTAYLADSPDIRASIRRAGYREAEKVFARADAFDVRLTNRERTVAGTYLCGKTDVLFYFAGLQRVPCVDREEYYSDPEVFKTWLQMVEGRASDYDLPKGPLDLTKNRFLPGAMADHLTSYGGVLTWDAYGQQMTSLHWLKAGATGSYGTVVEPTGTPLKFPRAAIAMDEYFRGATMVEAYWKSVEWPGQGLFLGDPLARPFGAVLSRREGALLKVLGTFYAGVTYDVEMSDSPSTGFEKFFTVAAPHGSYSEVAIPVPAKRYIRFVRQQQP